MCQKKIENLNVRLGPGDIFHNCLNNGLDVG